MAENSRFWGVKIFVSSALLTAGAAAMASSGLASGRNDYFYRWVVGSLMILFGGWMLPHRFTAGVFVGVGLTFFVLAVLPLLKEAITN